jgi:glycosyltransferase involved in cell wall biosynthesis
LVPLVSRGGVLHEVAGDGALGAEPLDEAEIASAMVRLHDLDAAQRGARLVVLREAIRRFDAESFARGWTAVFDDVTRPSAATARP